MSNIIRDAEIVLILTQLRGEHERMADRLDDLERVIKDSINENNRLQSARSQGRLTIEERA